MARKPEIVLRDLGPDEAQRLVTIACTSRDRVRLRRAGMALASMQARSVPEIAVMFAAKDETVRELIETFNDRGFAALDPKARRGSTPRIGLPVREQIAHAAKCDPARLGCPFTVWSLTKVRDHLAEPKHIRVSRETIRVVLKKAGSPSRTPRRGTVFTPTNASWTNWIGCGFTALRYFVLNGSDYPDQ